MIYRCLYTGVQPMNVCPGRAWLTIAITVKLIVSHSMHCMYFYTVFILVMASLNYYKSKFNWDALDKIAELDRLKSECEVLFNRPLDESSSNRQAGLVVNLLGSEAGLTLCSLNLMYDEPDTNFNALRDVFRPIGNRTMSRLNVLIKECGYEQNIQIILLKDQFIFGVTVREIQEHLLNEIGDDHDINQCLQEARQIESCIVQCKLLGLKSVQYDAIGECGRLKNKHQNPKIGSSPDLSLGLGTASIVVQTIHISNVKLMGKIVRHVVKRTILPRSASLGKAKAKALVVPRNHLNTGKSSDDNGQIDEITSKVRSMYYHDLHFNSENTYMHINLSTKSCNGNSMKTCFKVDTGADGNLLPLGVFFKHFPDANMTQLTKTIDPRTKLYAYNNTEIKQLGVCELLVEYKMNRKICEFYVVGFPTAILGT